MLPQKTLYGRTSRSIKRNEKHRCSLSLFINDLKRGCNSFHFVLFVRTFTFFGSFISHTHFRVFCFFSLLISNVGTFDIPQLSKPIDFAGQTHWLWSPNPLPLVLKLNEIGCPCIFMSATNTLANYNILICSWLHSTQFTSPVDKYWWCQLSSVAKQKRCISNLTHLILYGFLYSSSKKGYPICRKR